MQSCGQIQQTWNSVAITHTLWEIRDCIFGSGKCSRLWFTTYPQRRKAFTLVLPRCWGRKLDEQLLVGSFLVPYSNCEIQFTSCLTAAVYFNFVDVAQNWMWHLRYRNKMLDRSDWLAKTAWKLQSVPQIRELCTQLRTTRCLRYNWRV